MPFVPLTAGAYQARSINAAAQRCLNLFVEPTPQNTGEPLPATHYPTPGLTLLRPAPNAPIRALYTATTGNLYGCAGQQVFYIDPTWRWNLLGTMLPSRPIDATPRVTPVSMADNGSVILLADGSIDGWYIDITQPLASQSLARIDTTINTGWLGADWLDYQDTFFIANSPGTDLFYISQSEVNATTFVAAYQVEAATIVAAGADYLAGDVLTLVDTAGATITVNTVDATGAILTQDVTSGGVLSAVPSGPVATTGGSGNGLATFTLITGQGSGAFNPLDFAAKSGMADNLVAAISVHRVLWLLGTSSYEVWQNQGGDGTIAGSFPFSIMYGAFGNWGCAAKYSIAMVTNQVYWLHQDSYGRGMVMQGEGLAPKRISTHPIEVEISKYPTISDAVGYCYQQQGHIFYVLNFPSANDYRGATWVFDATTNEWHERAWIDDNGIEYRHRVNCTTEAYGNNVCGDWESSNLYAFDLNNYQDNGMPIKRLRSFPHQLDVEGNRRVVYNQLIAAMQVGAAQIGPNITVVDCSFTAPDLTLLQDYSNSNDIGATFSQDSDGVAEIYRDGMVAAASGAVSYTVGGAPTVADYVVSFNAQPANYMGAADNGTSLYAIGRANADGDGYLAGVISDGSQYNVELQVMPGTPAILALGTLASGFYSLTLTMQSTAISLAVQRSEDSLWLQADGSWGGSQIVALSIIDSTYVGPGQIIVGGNWT